MSVAGSEQRQASVHVASNGRVEEEEGEGGLGHNLKASLIVVWN